ncbi:DNA-directed RNA polymerase II subunit rpb1 [Eurytemora carolleeae]|uniref:DNA-directed RNA polymerase II subunit rpb1 n=1 Tax=Eurytemora carolleeae TaxID=1294199 RepID=UPI000C79014A|nr:DNA-directed RNA polymerase II subunit rpb1 [Eurytemora carolleeae]|eukprot:XP_023331627.1 DNA-directed RNA polymerase II subunit rpb1-like [Eurytemora affinis]
MLPSHPGDYDDYEESYKPKPYSFNYGVKDEYSGVEYNRAESRGDHGVTRGEYTVALPDGRLQLVSYFADEDGFHATVTYEGEPSYPTHEEYSRSPKSYRESNRVEDTNTVFAKPTPQPAPYSPTPAAYSPTPTPYSPTPAPYSPTPAPYSPTPAPYSPSPVPYSPTSAPYSPSPAPIKYSPTPAPYSPTPAPYSPTPAPYSPTPAPYSPTPAPYSPAPTPYSPIPASYSLSN